MPSNYDLNRKPPRISIPNQMPKLFRKTGNCSEPHQRPTIAHKVKNRNNTMTRQQELNTRIRVEIRWLQILILLMVAVRSVQIQLVGHEEKNIYDVFIVGKRANLVLSVNKDRCKGCKICVAVCPHDALAMGDVKSHRNVVNPVENGNCVGCQECVLACPDFALSIQKLRDVQVHES